MTKEKLNILFCIAIYGLLCQGISVFVIGFESAFTAGLLLGILTVLMNLSGLEKVIGCFVERRRVRLAFLIHLGRFLLFGAAGYLCFRISMTALAAYGFGVLSLTAGAAGAAVIELHKEGMI